MNNSQITDSIHCYKGVIRDSTIEIVIRASKYHQLNNKKFIVTLHLIEDKKNLIREKKIEVQSNIVQKRSNYYCFNVKIPLITVPIKSVTVQMINNNFKASELPYGEKWFLNNLCITSESEFNSSLSNAWTRVSDVETLLFISIQTAEYTEYDLSHAIASYVIFSYKSIELGKKDLLMQKFWLFDYFEEKSSAIFNRRGKIREDGRQVILSLLTAKWHVCIFLEKYDEVITVLKKVVEQKDLHEDYLKSTLSKNYGNACLLLGYICFVMNDHKTAYLIWKKLYLYYRDVVAEIPETPMHPSHFNDIGNCRKAVFLGLWGIKSISETQNPKKNLLNHESVFVTVSRIKKEKCDEFESAFFSYLDWIVVNEKHQDTSMDIRESAKLEKNILPNSTFVESRVDIESKEVKIRELEIRIEELYSQVNKLKNKNNNLRKKLENEKSKYRSIINSRTWRYTEPLRKIKRLFK